MTTTADKLGAVAFDITHHEHGCGWSARTEYDLFITLDSGHREALYTKIDARLVIKALQRVGLTKDEMDTLFRDKKVAGSW